MSETTSKIDLQIDHLIDKYHHLLDEINKYHSLLDGEEEILANLHLIQHNINDLNYNANLKEHNNKLKQ
jgi:DNA-binding MarR family transcriptional regulator